MKNLLSSLLKRFVPKLYKRRSKLFTQNCLQSLHYYLIEGSHFAKQREHTTNIIFVCKGNICRSAFAEQRMKDLSKQLNVMVDSCGLDVDQGNSPPPDSVAVATEFSCFIGIHRAKYIHECDIEGADLILPMEYDQYRRLIELYPNKKRDIKLLRYFAPFPSSLFCNIADPYGWGKDEFRRSFRVIDHALQRLEKMLANETTK